MRQYIYALFFCCAANAWADCDTAVVPTTPSSHFNIQKNTALVQDKRTGLIWQRCTLGMQWSATDNTCVISANTPSQFTWQAALAYANSSSFAGFTDWRVPNKKELASIVEYQCRKPALNTVIFGGGETLWTSTPMPYFSQPSVWVIQFNDGSFANSGITQNYGVRLVRN